jgi:hypothetical protein
MARTRTQCNSADTNLRRYKVKIKTLVLSKPWTTLKQREILVIEICKVINKAERNRKDVQLSLRMVV